MLEINVAKRKALKLMEKACVRCIHSRIDVFRNGLKCSESFKLKKVQPEHLCKKFIYSDFSMKALEDIFRKFPVLKEDKEIKNMAKSQKLNIKRKLYKENKYTTY